ncbi:MAG: [acyl-carrier-protein] S-malonyltransferase, partial [bacterium]|nr:[acyl-carrier-protein] S-malonyltransferase [bacterium]
EDPEVLKEALRKQMLGSVLWTDSVREMSSIGIEAFAEAGPGKALCGMIKKTDISLKTFNAEDMASLEKCAEELKAL